MDTANRGSAFRRRRLLIGLAVAVPVVEISILLGLRLTSGLGLAAQATALAPFGTFHDLRWLFVFHDSILAFFIGLTVVLAGRSLLTALVVQAAWPESAPRPRFRVLAGHALMGTAVAAVLLSPWVTLLFGVALVPVSWAFYAAVPAALLTMLLINHGAVDGAWWRRLPPLRSMGWIGLTFVVLSLQAMAVAGRTWPLAIPLTALGGLFNAWAWHHSVRSMVLRIPARRFIRFPATITAVVMLLVGIFAGAWLGFAAHADDGDPPVPANPDVGGQAVLLVPGYVSECCREGNQLQGTAPALLIEQFSYLGLDEHDRPLPHTGDATDADLSSVASLMARQVESLEERTDRPVVIVAESEGTLVAAAYLEAHPDAPVDRLMLLSPIVQPGRVTFPGPGEEGRGVVAGVQLRALAGVIDGISPFAISVDGPFGESVRRDAATLLEASFCDRPNIEEIAILPLADAVTTPPAVEYPIEVMFVPGFHGGLRGRPDIQAMIVEWAVGGDLEGSQVWTTLGRLISDSASAWQVPALGRFAMGTVEPPGCSA